MSPHSWLIIFSCLFLSTNALTAPINKHTIAETVRKYLCCIEKRGAHKTGKYQKKILVSLKADKCFSTNKELLSSTIALLALGKNYPEVNENQRILEKSIKYFWGTIGYAGTIMAFLRDLDNPNPSAKGRLYEIQCAVALHQCQKKKEGSTHKRDIIQAFNARKKVINECGETAEREFDIITHQLWIECKDRNFNKMNPDKKNGSEICSQLLEQKEIVARYNAQHHNAIRFQLHSKQPLPEHWKQWLGDNNIAFVEGY